VTIIRPRTILGHGRLGIFQILFEWVRSGLNVPVLGDGSQRLPVRPRRRSGRRLPARRRHERPGDVQHRRGAVWRHARHARGVGRTRRYRQSRRLAGQGAGGAAMKISSALRLSPLAPYHWLMYGESMYFDIAPARGRSTGSRATATTR